MALDSLRGDREFRKVRQHGVVLRDPLFTLRVTAYRPRHGEVWRPRAVIGIVVPKKTLKLAVRRNRARRRVREALRTLPLPPCRAILMPNPAVLDAPFEVVQAALARALAKVPGRVKGQGRGRGDGKARPQADRSQAGNSSGPLPVPAGMNSENLSPPVSEESLQ